MSSPAKRLKGLTLNDKWYVEELIVLAANQTGGHFSVGYKVKTESGDQGFLKALDYHTALQAPDPATVIQALTEAFNFERAVLQRCRDRKLDRVVKAIEDGTTRIDFDGAQHTIQYLIFELADGDVRKQLDLLKSFDLAWILRSLHHIATGLKQLHGEGIAHQDLKPSNVLIFNNAISKIGDLGRSAYQGHTPPHENYTIPGDISYAPPEQLYGFVPQEWNLRRLGCDAYQLGSLVVFFFTGISMTALWARELHPSHFPGRWNGTFEDVLPYLRQAFGQAMLRLQQEIGDKLGEILPEIQSEIVTIVRELCEPSPQLRCDYQSRNSGKLLLERYITRFDRLARKTEMAFTRG